MPHALLRLGAPLAIAALALAGCGQPSETPGTAGNAITVKATDTSCELSSTTAPVGPVTFSVTNSGTKVNEFYIYDGERIVSEVENISAGLTRELKVEFTEPGTYTTACKPGMTGDGIRADFTVTGTAVTGGTDEKTTKAIADYKTFVAHEADELLEGTKAFVAAVKAGDVAKAKELYVSAREPWEVIEPVAESFGDLDPKIDGREDVVAEGLKFTGYHRLEKDLWVTGLQQDSSAIADQLLTDVTEVVKRSKEITPTVLNIAGGAKTLMDEIATSKITGEEERYSHTDLADVRANLEGAQQALAALKPIIIERDAAVQTALDATFTAANDLVDSHEVDGALKLYTELTQADIKTLTVSLDALAEEVAKVPGIVEK
jgi:iron uptake system component EfeO